MGKIQFSSTKAVKGNNARIVGMILIAAGVFASISAPVGILCLVGSIVFGYSKAEENPKT